MANIRIPCLVARTNGAGVTSWYWQPSATLRKAGWKPVALGRDESAAINAARARNAEVALWKTGGHQIATIRKRSPSGTVGALIDRYRKEVLNGKHPNGRPIIAASTASVYGPSLKRIEAWAGNQPLAFVTPARVKALRIALTGPAEKGGISHHSAHQMLKMGRQLFAFAISCDLVDKNPFDKFGLAAPPPRDVVWSPAAREAFVAAAHKSHMPSIALAIQLGFAIGQREADLLKLQMTHYVAIPEHKMQPEDWATHCAWADDGVPRGIRIRQNKTGAWIEVLVVGDVRRALEANIIRARARSTTHIIIDDTRPSPLYAGKTGQARFQQDFADVRAAVIADAKQAGNTELAQEAETLQFRDLRRTCVVYLGELGLDAHLIAAITGHDIDETQRILKVYMPTTTGRAARAIALSHARQLQQEAQAKKTKGAG